MVLDHLQRGRAPTDTRQPHFHRDATIPGASGIPHEQIPDHLDEFDPRHPTVFLWDGPQRRATPDAVHALLDAGYPPRGSSNAIL
jgi:hypothetical protein